VMIRRRAEESSFSGATKLGVREDRKKAPSRNGVASYLALAMLALLLLLGGYVNLWPVAGTSCDVLELKESIESPHFTGDIREEASLAEIVALAKAEFILREPFAPNIPPLISACERELNDGSSNRLGFKNIVVKHRYLEHLVPRDTPENILHILLGSTTRTAIVDIGANVGQFALPLAKEGHTVYSFEPIEGTCEILKQNVKKDGVERLVRVFCVGVDEKEATKAFGYVGDSDPGSPGYGTIDPDLPDAHVLSTVRTGPVQAFLGARELNKIHVFKTDTQGFEEGVLRGAKKLLHSPRHPRFLLVEFSYFLLTAAGTNPIDVLDLIYDAGYVCTHLHYHHPIMNGDKKVFTNVDTPGFMARGSIGASFSEMQHSVQQHGEWKYAGRPISSEVMMLPGWTDLLCFG